MNASSPAAVAKAPVTSVVGTFYRHCSLKHVGLAGHSVGGRWAPTGSFPVLYLGRPPDSVVIEAYRHLVDPVEGMTAELVGPRMFLTCDVRVSEVLDLRDERAQALVGLTQSDLTSDVGSYEACQRVGARAHQLGRRGLIAPAATGRGETLVLFTARIPAEEMPTVIERELWEHLPRDPRQLWLLKGQGGG